MRALPGGWVQRKTIPEDAHESLLKRVISGIDGINMRMTEKISDLEKRRAQLEAQIQSACSRERENERKSETRSKIVLGAAVIKLAREHDGFRLWLVNSLESKVDQRDWQRIRKALEKESRK
jgi:hypothetical protein